MMNEQMDITNKSVFKINEVCSLTGVKSYVLRFWESEFTEISPVLSSSGVKIYQKSDIDAILLIKKLLFEDKFSIERSKSMIKNLLHNTEELIPSHPLKIQTQVQMELPNEVTLDEKEEYKAEVKESKLEKAKIKLMEIINLTELIEQKYNWA